MHPTALYQLKRGQGLVNVQHDTHGGILTIYGLYMYIYHLPKADVDKRGIESTMKGVPFKIHLTSLVPE